MVSVTSYLGWFPLAEPDSGTLPIKEIPGFMIINKTSIYHYNMNWQNICHRSRKDLD